MQNRPAKELLKKYVEGNCNEAEKAMLESWHLSRDLDILPDLNPEERLADLDEVWMTLEKEHKSSVKTKRLWPRIAAVASIIVVLSAGLLFYNYFDIQKNLPDLPPGHNSATLTLANGRKIRLSDAINGDVAKEAGVKITKTANGQLVYTISDSPSSEEKNQSSQNTLSTARGETYQIVLPDKSVVWLNAASSLKYPSSFATLSSRKVELDGEAYFEITKDKAHPFIVQSRGQEVQVLGTHFNINSYADEPSTKTTLLEGSIQLNKRTILVPGQQSVLKGNNLQIVRADTEEAVAWKNGDFNFKKGDDFKSAMRKIARWYNVEVVYDVSATANIDLGGWISRKNNITKVLELIESAANVNLKLEGRRITVTK